MRALQKYVQKMERLRIDRAHGVAPNKPLLLLAVIELIEHGHVPENKIILSPNLAETFLKYWSKVTDRKPNIALPFFHLKSEEFWHLHANVGYETALRVASQLKTASRVREIIAYASLDDALFILLTNPQDREEICRTLINKYFPDFEPLIENLITEEQQIGAYRQLLIQEIPEHPFSYQIVPDPSEEDNPIRSAAFRREIMRLYNYTCAVCGLRIVTMDGESATEAAHIIPFSNTRDDDIRNGISLCKLHHWAFDKGLISLSKTYKVIVSELMSEEGPTEWMLRTLSKKSVLLPEHDLLYPAQDALAWHREKIFRK